MPDDSVRLFLDGALRDKLAAGEIVILSVEAGPHDVEFVPLSLNPFRSTVVVDGEMQWKVLFAPPPGAKDVSQVVD